MSEKPDSDSGGMAGLTALKKSWFQVPEETSLSFCDVIEARMFNARVVPISGEIEEFGAALFTGQMQALAESDADVTLLLTSNGGSVEAGGAYIRAIRHAQSAGCTVIGEVRGYAMSMASVILQACDVRTAAPEDIVMVHGFVGTSVGDIRNTEADAALMKKFTEVYAKLYAARSTAEEDEYRTEEYWTKLLKDSLPHYYFGEEALEKGLIDALVVEEK